MRNKRGDEKYYLIISLILGLMVLSLSLYFIFNEYFTKDVLDWQACRQSIILRTNLPEADLVALKTDVRDAFPLKCRTEVVEINSAKNSGEVFGKISEAIAEGWYMFGEGKFDFIHRNFWTEESVCMVFARVHYSSDTLKDYEQNNLWITEFRKVYGSNVDIFSREQMAQKAFIDYYNFNFLENTKETYGDYLPLSLDGSTSSRGDLFVNWEKVNFVPQKENKDLFVVYRINKFSSVVVTVASFLSPINPLGSQKKAEKYEKYRSIVLTTSDELQDIGCDKFLSIPA